MSQKRIDQNLGQPIIAIQIPTPRIRPMLKIKDLLEESNLRHTVDIVAVIVKVGELKKATQTPRGTVPAREIYLCDDSWTMIKLIARDYFAESSANFRSNQILFIKNVKPMKLRGYIVLATVQDTLLSPEENTPEARSLSLWLTQNYLDFKQDGLTKFSNLSSSEDRNLLQALSGAVDNFNKELQCSQPSQSSNVVTASKTNDATGDKNSINAKAEKSSETDGLLKVLGNEGERKRKCTEERDSPMKCLRTDFTIDIVKGKDSEDTSSDIATQKFNVDTTIDYDCTALEKASTKDNLLIVISDDESTEKENINNQVKKDIIKKELDADTEAVDDDEDSIISETYKSLMTSESKEIWDEVRDRYIVNFLSKYCTKQLTDAIYFQLLQTNLNVFRDSSIEDLKSRADILASAKNYMYLLKLCGGEKIRSEKEKCTFVDRVERLRRLMKNKEFKDEIVD